MMRWTTIWVNNPKQPSQELSPGIFMPGLVYQASPTRTLDTVSYVRYTVQGNLGILPYAFLMNSALLFN